MARGQLTVSCRTLARLLLLMPLNLIRKFQARWLVEVFEWQSRTAVILLTIYGVSCLYDESPLVHRWYFGQ